MVFCPFIASNATFALKSLLYFFGELVMGFLLGNALLLPAILSHEPVHFPGTIIVGEETSPEFKGILDLRVTLPENIEVPLVLKVRLTGDAPFSQQDTAHVLALKDP